MLKLKGDVNKLLRGISFSWLRFAVTVGIGITQTPILFKSLTTFELNFWYIFYSFGAFLQMADLGLIQTISRLIAYLDNTNGALGEGLEGSLAKYKIKQIYATTFFSFTCILVLIGIVVYGLFIYLHIDKETSYGLKVAFFIYVFSVISTLLSNVPSAMLIGYRDVGTESIIRIIFQILYFLILAIGLPYYKSIVFVSIAFLIQNVGQLIVLHFTFFIRHSRIFKEHVPVRELLKLNISYNIYKQSLPLVINQLGAWLINQGNIFIASVVIGPEKISDYAINQQVFIYIASVALVINQALGPFIAKQYIQQKNEALQQLFLNTVILCMSIVSILLLIQITCGYEIIDFWVGSSHYLGLPFSIIFGLITFLEVHHSVAGNFVWNTKSWPFNIWTLAAGLLNITLGYILGKYYGLIGMVSAAFIARLITLNWYVIYYCLTRLNILMKVYISKIFVPLTLLVFLVFIINFSLKIFLLDGYSNNYIVLIISFTSFVFISFTIGIIFRNHLKNLYKMLFFKISSNAVENII